MVTFLPLGGADDIGASCFYLNIDETGIILDCGTHPRKTGIDSLPLFEHITNRNVDAVLISHAHQDHIDALPYLIQKHPYLRIVTTPQTRAIAELTLHNSVNILQEQCKNGTTLRTYTHEEIDLLIQSIEWRSYKEQFSIEGYRHSNTEHITGTFHDAGHILGSCGIFLEYGKQSIFYTGDVNVNQQALLPGAAFPSQNVDVLILECTHGATDDSSFPMRNEEEVKLVKAANKVLERGGSVLLPVFALGKLQEMLAILWKQIQKGTLANVDIYTGGVGKKICRVYDKNRFVVPYKDSEFILDDVPQKDIYDVEDVDTLARENCIVLASSGMLIENTISFKLAKQWLPHPKNAIFTVGYMDPETPGYRIVNSKKGDLIQLVNSMEPFTVKCDVERFRFSSHSTRSELLSIVERLKPKTVILVHGDHEATDWMGHAILNRYPTIKVHGAETGKQITLFG